MNSNFNLLGKWQKRTIAFGYDITATIIALIVTNWINENVLAEKLKILFLQQFLIIQAVMYVCCGLYRGVWRFASIPDMIRIFQAISFGIAATIILLKVEDLNLPIKIYITYFSLLIIFLSAPRLFFRWLRDYRSFKGKGKRILVIGAGSAGEGIIRALRRSANTEKYIPIGFIDDDPTRRGSDVQGVRVLGDCHHLQNVVKNYNIDAILIAIPSATSARMREIVHYCELTNIPFKTLPSLKEITNCQIQAESLREVLIEDLLGREEVKLDWDAIKHSIFNKTILVTGGGGSIGTELCRQISRLYPDKLIIVENSEYNLFAIDTELRAASNITIHSHLCSVTDHIELNKIFEKYQPDLVFHVAAYKHVPLLENHVRVSMYNNIVGTKNVANLAVKHHVETFVLISTDKAVNPTNIMGATKRAAEVLCQNYNAHSNTKFVTVRFGNVLNSTGSVIPIFRKQIQEGGPITVTHKDITRYFMTIPEASQLILQAVTMHNEGEIFVLDMGEPIKISYLAEQMIKLSGKSVEKNIKIKFIGLRPGEKLHEELFHKNEDFFPTSHPKINRATIRSFDWDILIGIINAIEESCHSEALDEKQLKQLLYKLVPEYQEYQKTIDISSDSEQFIES